MLNLSAFVAFHARQRPAEEAILFRDQRITWLALQARTEALSGLLAARGVGAGGVVAAFMKNSSAFVELAIAASRIGAVFLPINYRLARDEVAWILDNAGAALLFADSELLSVVDGLPGLVAVDEAAQSDPSRLAPPGTPVPPVAPRQEGDLFRLMYTSGTTDRPKGVMHSYGNFYWKCMEHAIALGLGRRDRLLIVGPLYHVGAFDLPGLGVLWVGGTLCILRDFDAGEAIRAIARERLTGAWMAPVMLSRTLEHGNPEGLDLTSLQWCIGGGEKTPEGRIRDFTKLFTSGRYIDAYGLTETCAADTFMEAGRELEKSAPPAAPRPMSRSPFATKRAPPCRRVRRARSASAAPRCSTATGRTRSGRRPPSTPMPGSAPAMSATSTRTASSSSPTGART